MTGPVAPFLVSAERGKMSDRKVAANIVLILVVALAVAGDFNIN